MLLLTCCSLFCPPLAVPHCSYYWFTLALEFVTLAGLTVTSIMGLLAASALSWMAWLTVLSLLTIQSSDTFLALRSGTVSFPWQTTCI